MHPILRNILAFIAGAIIGGFVNSGIVMFSGSVIPPPDGIDLTTEEGLRSGMHLMQPKHFIMPFLAHALGTLAGAFITAKIAATYKMQLALGIGVLFLAGGIWMIFLVPSPLWFTILDLGVAYLPMGYLGGKLGSKK